MGRNKLVDKAYLISTIVDSYTRCFQWHVDKAYLISTIVDSLWVVNCIKVDKAYLISTIVDQNSFICSRRLSIKHI